MGVTYSSESAGRTHDQRIQLTYYDCVRIVECFEKHKFHLLTDADGLASLFLAAFGHERMMSSEIAFILSSFQTSFLEDNKYIYTQEVLATLILLCDAPWPKRAALLFLIFRTIGTEEMGHEDFILASQIVAVALCRLWKAPKWNSKTMTTLTEAIADNAYTKLEKDIDDLVDCNGFVAWATDRFRESKTIASSDALKSLYMLPV